MFENISGRMNNVKFDFCHIEKKFLGFVLRRAHIKTTVNLKLIPKPTFFLNKRFSLSFAANKYFDKSFYKCSIQKGIIIAVGQLFAIGGKKE